MLNLKEISFLKKSKLNRTPYTQWRRIKVLNYIASLIINWQRKALWSRLKDLRLPTNLPVILFKANRINNEHSKVAKSLSKTTLAS